MRYLTVLTTTAIAAVMAGCSGANNTNVNSNAEHRNPNTMVNTSPPAANLSPANPPPTMMPANTMNANGARQPIGRMPPGMANEKMTPAPNHPPGYLGPPIKKPSP